MTPLVPLLMLPAALLLFSPIGRLFLVTAAGFLVFTPGFAALAIKVAFVALLLVSSAVSLLRLRNSGLRPSGGLLASVACYATAILIAALVGWTDDPQRTLQSGLPYLLILLLLPIAMDAGLESSFRLIETGLVVTGVRATMSFAIFWLDRRGISNLETEQLLASSLLMPALAFQWGLMTAGQTSRGPAIRVVAIAVSLFVPLAFLVTGARTSLVFFAGLAAALIWGLRKRRMLRTAIAIAGTVALAFPLLNWLTSSSLLTRADFVSERIASLRRVLSFGSGADRSVQLREMATLAAQRNLEGNWVLGRGLSTPDPVTPFDTPLAIVMRFGVVGTFLFILYVFMALRWAMSIAPRDSTGDSVRGIIVGWLLIVVAFGMLIPPVADSLFPFAFAIAIALAISSRYGQSEEYSTQSVGLTPNRQGGILQKCTADESPGSRPARQREHPDSRASSSARIQGLLRTSTQQI